ncbi:MAG: response regulator [Caulobacteraceae bacterium]|nr:response regulator [Caulobacter sp.]
MADTTTADGARRSDKLRILLVEDDDADAYLIGRALLDIKRVGQFIRVRTGQEAVELLETREFTPDLAFVDLQMPVMNGFEFLLACVERDLANIPMVVLTSSSSPTDAARSRIRGALRVITKPENMQELYAVLQTAIETLAGPKAPGEDANPGRARFFLPDAPPAATGGLRRPDAGAGFGRRGHAG